MSPENSVTTVPTACPRPDAGFGVRVIWYDSADGTEPSAATTLALAEVKLRTVHVDGELLALTVLQNAGAAADEPDAKTHRPILLESV